MVQRVSIWISSEDQQPKSREATAEAEQIENVEWITQENADYLLLSTKFRPVESFSTQT